MSVARRRIGQFFFQLDPVESGTHARQHGVQADANAEEEHQFARQTQAQQALLQLRHLSMEMAWSGSTRCRQAQAGVRRTRARWSGSRRNRAPDRSPKGQQRSLNVTGIVGANRSRQSGEADNHVGRKLAHAAVIEDGHVPSGAKSRLPGCGSALKSRGGRVCRRRIRKGHAPPGLSPLRRPRCEKGIESCAVVPGGGQHAWPTHVEVDGRNRDRRVAGEDLAEANLPAGL